MTLCGASGENAAKINQPFMATRERLNGAPVFAGVDDSSHCLCIAADGNWHVQPVVYKGQNGGCAYIKDKASPLDPAFQWEVANKGFEEQSVRASAEPINELILWLRAADEHGLPFTKPDATNAIKSAMSDFNTQGIDYLLEAADSYQLPLDSDVAQRARDMVSLLKGSRLKEENICPQLTAQLLHQMGATAFAGHEAVIEQTRDLSERLGVAVPYITGDFRAEALVASHQTKQNADFPVDLDNPSFYHITEFFCKSEHSKGYQKICPRDWQPNCSVVVAAVALVVMC